MSLGTVGFCFRDVSREEFRKLELATAKGGRFYTHAEIGEVGKFDANSIRRVVVEVNGFGGLTREEAIPTTLGMVGEIFTIFDYFPPSGKLPHKVSMPLLTILSITGRIKEMMRECDDGNLIRDTEKELELLNSYVRVLQSDLEELL